MSMPEDIKSALRQAIAASLAVVRAESENYRETCLVWIKRGTGQWSGKYCDRAHLDKIFSVRRKQFEEAAEEFVHLFMAKYPDYRGPIGLHNPPQDRIRLQVTRIPESAIRWLWYVDGYWCAESGLNVDDAVIEAIVADFAESVERSSVRLRFQGQLLNFRMNVDVLDLPDNLSVRRLNEVEVSALDGGSLIALGFMRPP